MTARRITRTGAAAALCIVLAAAMTGPMAVAAVEDEIAEEGAGLVTVKLETETAGDPISTDVEFEGVDTITVDTIEDDYPLTQERPPGQYYVALTSDPDGEWEVTKIECDDAASPTPSNPNPDERMVRVGVDPGENLTCTFTVASGEVIIKMETEPDTILGVDYVVPSPTDGGCSFSMPSVPGGASSCGSTTVPHDFVTVITGGDGTILRPPGAYLVEIGTGLPDDWGVADVECDDIASEEPSFGDPDAWSATYNIEPEERVRCTFTLAQGEGVIKLKTEPRGREVSLSFTVAPTDRPDPDWESSTDTDGAVVAVGTTVSVIDVAAGEQYGFKRGPGIYDAPISSELGDRWEVDKITCEEGAGENPSFGDKATATAIYGIDAEEKVTCTYVVRDKTVPRKGPWRVTETSARMSCPRADDQPLERSGPQQFRLRIGNQGRRITGSGDGSITMREQAPGRYRGRAKRARVDWHVRSDKHITGTNTARAGRGCKIVRKFDMRYTGN